MAAEMAALIEVVTGEPPTQELLHVGRRFFPIRGEGPDGEVSIENLYELDREYAYQPPHDHRFFGYCHEHELVVEFGEDVLVAVRGRQGLQVQDLRGVLRVTGAVAPLAPVARDITRGFQRIAHRKIIGAHRLLGIVGIIAIGKRVPLVKSRLL